MPHQEMSVGNSATLRKGCQEIVTRKGVSGNSATPGKMSGNSATPGKECREIVSHLQKQRHAMRRVSENIATLGNVSGNTSTSEKTKPRHEKSVGKQCHTRKGVLQKQRHTRRRV